MSSKQYQGLTKYIIMYMLVNVNSVTRYNKV